jgi:hypothetical protein
LDTKDAFNIPHDLKILKEVFKCDHGSYANSNAYWTSYDIVKLIDALPDQQDRETLHRRVVGLKDQYNHMSDVYQQHKKEGNRIPLN